MVTDYIKWHYGRGFRELMGLSSNFLRFILHFFSLGLLFKTLFHPWRRMSENYSSGLDIEAAFSSLVVNMIMRSVGFVSRAGIIIVGLLFLFAFTIIAAFAMALWLVLPVVLIILIIIAVSLILESL
jgi:hypothetical protein